ncbi:sigma-70 family RNA polymerase sigma factor [Proteiniphilum sp.]|uniref:sigma-70 family RNA polymerase sigma factor n=1 Tax=Proteiniphilum sp. TaxID=1926877 RepID=UPI0033206C8B
MEVKSDLKTLNEIDLADLFLRMSLKEENRQDAEQAFSLLYERYKDFIYTVVKKACLPWKMYGEDLILSVHQNTFLTVYQKADQFLLIDEVVADKKEYRLKAWLAAIAKNEMYQLLREFKEYKEKMVRVDDLSFTIFSLEPEVTEEPSANLLLVEKALNTLNERDKHILITYLMYEDGNRKLPREEIQKLADMWNVHPDNMRQIKKRSLDKIKKYMGSYNHLSK